MWFAGALVIRAVRDSPLVKAGHKFKQKKNKLFSLQKQQF